MPAQRIVSLVPSQTELLFNLGLREEVVGITKFCIHPNEWFRSKQRVGGTKTVNIENVKKLEPTLIIANKEENVKEQIEALEEVAEVWTSDITTLEDAIKMISTVSQKVDREDKGEEIKQRIVAEFEKIKPNETGLRSAYLIWKEPYMTVGGDTFINDMMCKCGIANIFEAQKRYPETSIEYLQHIGCQLLLLSSEPYPFSQKHIVELQRSLPATRILLVDGEMFSWYGSRLILAPAYFNRLLEQLR